MRIAFLAVIHVAAAFAQTRPVVRDAIVPVPLAHSEMGGVIDDRIMSLVENHYMVLDVDGRWLAKFRNRDETPEYGKGWRYEGLGKLIDAGALLSVYTRDAAVAERTKLLLEGLRATRDADGYLGFWRPVADNRQDYVNWTLHEQEYILLGQVRYYLCTGDVRALDDARTMADYILRTFPTPENGIDATYPANNICTAGLPEAFLALYGVTKDRRYLDFAANVRHGNGNSEIRCASLRTWNQDFTTRPCHVYVMTARCYAQTELYRVTGEDSLLDMSRKMRLELFAKGRGGMLVTGSCSEGEHFTYNQNGAGNIGESCVTAYMMRWLESLMRLEGNFAYGDVLERSMYNALFAALTPDGRRIRYFTPFTGERKYDGHSDGFCCCGNFRRAMAELPRKVCYVTSCGALAVNLYAPFAKTFEVNGKEMEFITDTTGIITKRIKPNFKTLGKVYGARMKEIRAALVRRHDHAGERRESCPGRASGEGSAGAGAEMEGRRHRAPFHADAVEARARARDAGRTRGASARTDGLLHRQGPERGAFPDVSVVSRPDGRSCDDRRAGTGRHGAKGRTEGLGAGVDDGGLHRREGAGRVHGICRSFRARGLLQGARRVCDDSSCG